MVGDGRRWNRRALKGFGMLRCARVGCLWLLRSRNRGYVFVDEFFNRDGLLVLARGLTTTMRILRDSVSSERTTFSIPELRGQVEKN